MSLMQGNQGQTGKAVGQNLTAGFGEFSDVLVSELQGRFYEACYRATLFSAGSSTTALSANTITTGATTTPIVGVWNPLSSPVNLVIHQASLQCVLQATAATTQGAFVWAASNGNNVITTGAAPFNRKTLLFSGSQAKAFNGGVALTGLSNTLTIFEGADLTAGNQITTTATATTAVTPPTVSVQNFDGSLIVPPGGVLALLNTNSTANISVASRLMWAEIPI